jgi:hypothetical protein
MLNIAQMIDLAHSSNNSEGGWELKNQTLVAIHDLENVTPAWCDNALVELFEYEDGSYCLSEGCFDEDGNELAGVISGERAKKMVALNASRMN